MGLSITGVTLLVLCISGSLSKSIHKRASWTDQFTGLMGGQNPASGITSQLGNLPMNPESAISSITGGGQTGTPAPATPTGAASDAKASWTDQFTGLMGGQNPASGITSQLGNLPMNPESAISSITGGGQTGTPAPATPTGAASDAKASWTDQFTGLMGGQNPASGITSQLGNLPMNPESAISSITGGGQSTGTSAPATPAA